MLAVVLVQDDQIPLGEAQEGGIYACYETRGLDQNLWQFDRKQISGGFADRTETLVK